MELELRNENGIFIVSFCDHMAESLLKYFLENKNISFTNKVFNNKTYRCIVNYSDEDIFFKNEYIIVALRKNEYFRIIN